MGKSEHWLYKIIQIMSYLWHSDEIELWKIGQSSTQIEGDLIGVQMFLDP